MASELTRSGAQKVLNTISQKSPYTPGTLQGELLNFTGSVESILAVKVPFDPNEFTQPVLVGSTWQTSNANPYSVGTGAGDGQGAGPGDYDFIGLGSGFGTTFPNSLDMLMAELGGDTNPPSGTVFSAGQYAFGFTGYASPPASGTFYPTQELARDMLHWMLRSHIPVLSYTLEQNSSWSIRLHDASSGLAGSALTYSWASGDMASPISGATGTYIQNSNALTLTTNSGLGLTSYLASTGNAIKYVSIEVNGVRYWSQELSSQIDVPAGSTVTIAPGAINVGLSHIF